MRLRLTALVKCSFLLTLAAAFPATAQTSTDARVVFINVNTCIESAKNSFKVDSTEESMTRDIADIFNELKGKWEGGVKKDLPAEYLVSLQGYCPLFQDATSLHKNSNKKVEILRYIKRDLSAKVDAAGGVGHAASTMAASIRVTVRTIKEGVEVSGYLVRCNPKLFGITSSAKYPFGDESSPTIEDLPPGFYACWIEDKNGKPVTKPRDIPIKDANGEEFKFSID